MRTAYRFFFICLLIISSNYNSAQAQDRNVAHFTLPPSNQSGLTDIFFQYEPEFSLDYRKLENITKVSLNMNIEPSRADNVKGSFWYRYRYNGQQYTEVHVGKDVFLPINLHSIHLTLRIYGPKTLSKKISYNSNLRKYIIFELPGEHKPSEFMARIEGLEKVYFKGNEAIDRAIENLLAAKREKEANDKRKEAEKLAAEKKAAAEKVNKEKALAQKNAPDSKGTGGSTTKNKTDDDDFWETGKKSTATSTGAADHSRLPDMFRTNDGKYYRKDANGKVQEVSYDEYQQMKFDQSKKIAAQKEAVQKAKQIEAKKTAADQMAKIKQDQEAIHAAGRQVEQNVSMAFQAIGAANARDNARKSLNATTTLSGNYESVDQLMADFEQRMSMINSQVSELTQRKNDAWNNAIDANFSGQGEAAYGASLKIIGTMVNQAKQAKEQRKAEERLEAQKNAMMKQIEAEQSRLLTGIRSELFTRFKEGALPLSSTKLEASVIYYFVYAYDPAQLGARQSILYISNVFPVARYSDGTWPFKTSFSNDINKLTPFTEVMHGYYTSEEEAESMRQGLINIYQRSGGYPKALVFKGKKPSASSASSTKGDFWETGKKKEAAEKKPVKKDDFWNN